MPCHANPRQGVLVECDPSIKSIIINLDKDSNAYIIEDLDETHLLVKENTLTDLKARLDDVRTPIYHHERQPLTTRCSDSRRRFPL